MVDDILIEDKQILDAHNLKVRFPEECKRLPFEYLEEHEKIIADKCINQEKLSEGELSDLKRLLAEYRPFLRKYDVEEVEKNLEKNLNVIKTSDELLRLLDDENRYRIDMNYKIGDETYLLKLKIRQIPDDDYIRLLDAQTKIFRDLTNSEKKVYAKMAQNQQLTQEELNMQKHIQDKINEMTFDFGNRSQDITQILAKTVDFVDDPEKPYHEKLNFWKKIDLSVRVLLFNKVREKLNIQDDLNENLFPDVG